MVHVIDVEKNASVADIVVGNQPRRFALTGDGSRLWVTNEIGGTVSIIDTGANKVVGEIQFEPQGFPDRGMSRRWASS
ncbi:MAG: hypothetical protein R3E83_17925 [Burkholderiaceae bacterium]